MNDQNRKIENIELHPRYIELLRALGDPTASPLDIAGLMLSHAFGYTDAAKSLCVASDFARVLGLMIQIDHSLRWRRANVRGEGLEMADTVIEDDVKLADARVALANTIEQLVSSLHSAREDYLRDYLDRDGGTPVDQRLRSRHAHEAYSAAQLGAMLFGDNDVLASLRGNLFSHAHAHALGEAGEHAGNRRREAEQAANRAEVETPATAAPAHAEIPASDHGSGSGGWNDGARVDTPPSFDSGSSSDGGSSGGGSSD